MGYHDRKIWIPGMQFSLVVQLFFYDKCLMLASQTFVCLQKSGGCGWGGTREGGRLVEIPSSWILNGFLPNGNHFFFWVHQVIAVLSFFFFP